MLIAPGVVVSWNWTGDLRVSASGSSSQMACIVIVKETHRSEPWALEHVIIELDTFTALFRTSLTRSQSMLSAQGSRVALRWSERIGLVAALVSGTRTGWGFAWFSPASSDNCRVMKPALWCASPFTFLDAFAKFHKAALCSSVRKENSAVTGRMLLKSYNCFYFHENLPRKSSVVEVRKVLNCFYFHENLPRKSSLVEIWKVLNCFYFHENLPRKSSLVEIGKVLNCFYFHENLPRKSSLVEIGKNNRHLTWGTRVIYVIAIYNINTVFPVRYGMTPKKVFRI